MKSMLRSIPLAGIYFALLLASTAHVEAQSLAQKKLAKGWSEDVQSSKESAVKACGKNFEVELDENSVWQGDVPEDQQSYSLGGYCANGCMLGLEMVCRDELGKEAVSEKIDKVVCKYQTDDKPKITLEGNTMNCAFSYRNMQFQDETKEQLENLL